MIRFLVVCCLLAGILVMGCSNPSSNDKDVGPAKWVMVANQPFGEFVLSGGYLYGGGYGVFRSADNGTTWTSMSTGMPNGVWVSALSVVGQNTIFALCDVLYKSTNGGASWTASGSSAMDTNMTMAILAYNGYLFAGDMSAIYRSADTGKSWAAVKSTMTMMSFESAGNYIFAGTDGSGVLRSADNGTTWTDANGGVLDSTTIVAMAGNGGSLFAYVVRPGDVGSVYRSMDNGASWAFVLSDSPSSMTEPFATNGPILFFSSIRSGTVMSQDNGTTWAQAGMDQPGGFRTLFTVNGYLIGSTSYTTWRLPLSGI